MKHHCIPIRLMCERVAILEQDGGLSKAEIHRRGILSQRTINHWRSHPAVHTSPHRLLVLDQHVRRHTDVPWSSELMGSQVPMWEVSLDAGQTAVVEHLQAAVKEAAGAERNRIEGRLLAAASRPERACDILPELFRSGAARALREAYRPFVRLMVKYFASREFPKPHDAEGHADAWTVALLLTTYVQSAQDVILERDGIGERVWTWLEQACGPYAENDRVWAWILQLRLAEAKLVLDWPKATDLMARRALVTKLDWLPRLDRYHQYVTVDAATARNALAIASAIECPGQYEMLLGILRRADSRWNDPLRMRHELDTDFEHFLAWYEYRTLPSPAA